MTWSLKRWQNLAGCATVSVALVVLAMPAAAARCDHAATDRPKIGLVLGGGGARGSAHIGVIRVLEEMQVPVDFVGGTSIGSLVGALYATGMTADELEHVMLTLDWDDLFRDDTARRDQPFRRKRDDNLALFGPKLGIGKGATLVPRGAIAGQKISFIFQKMVRERTQATSFDDLPIPYRAVAADVISGEQVVFASGDLAIAMRASMSVPGVFDPVAHEGRMLVDGGIVNNLPVDVVRAMGADIVIAVDVGSGLRSKEELQNALAIVGQLSNLMIKFNTDRQLASLGDGDVLIRPELGNRVSSADFDKAPEGIAIGYQAASAIRENLAHLSVTESEYAAYRASIAACVEPMPAIDFVDLDNNTRFSDSVVLERITVRPGEPLDTQELDQNLRQIHALGFIELARYEVVNRDGATGVVVHVDQDVRGTQMLEWGIDYAGDADSSSVNLRLGYLDSAVDDFGSELRVIAQVGETPAVVADLYKYLDQHLKLFVEPQAFFERREITTYQSGDPTLVSRVSQYGGAFYLGREIANAASLAVGVRAFTGDVRAIVGESPVSEFDYDGGEFVVRASYDRLDDRYFPRDGGFADIRYNRADSALGAGDEYEQITIDAIGARSFGRHTVLGGARYYETLTDTAPVYAAFRAGGLARLSGYHDDEVVGQNFAMVLGGYRYHFAGSGLLPAHLGTTVEYGGVAENASDLFEDGALNGSVYFGYNSPIGPLYLGAGFAEGGRHRYFLRIGNVFGTSTIAR
ncbi:MAG: patatin-like phospholipase family protein [Pseudomonadales bacterium]|nr:patatin-like phospholipase family protein [Pseudomonadales bacterium]